MRESTKVLMIMSTMSVIFDVLEGRNVDLSDFDDAIEMIGFEAREFKELHPFKMIHELSKKLAEIEISVQLLDELIENE